MATKSWLTPRVSVPHRTLYFCPPLVLTILSTPWLSHSTASATRKQAWNDDNGSNNERISRFESWNGTLCIHVQTRVYEVCTKMERKKSWNATRHFPLVILGHQPEFWLFKLTEIYNIRKRTIVLLKLRMTNILANITRQGSNIFLPFFSFLSLSPQREENSPSFVSSPFRSDTLINRPLILHLHLLKLQTVNFPI